MRNILRLSLLALGFLLVGGIISAAEKISSPRQAVTLTEGWKFHRGSEAQAAAPEFADAAWETVALPHTWNAHDGEDGGGDYYRGDGWYRQRFRVDAAWTGRRIFLQFDGANRSAEVFLNGQRLGQHRGGFARFRFDITSALNFSGENVLAVRVNNRTDDNMIPVSADYTFCGGLYRAVSLVATSPVHIDLLDYASPGVYVRPSAVSESAAQLDVSVKLANDQTVASAGRVRVTVIDAAGQVVASGETAAALDPLARTEAKLRLEIAKPHLWNGQADPYLYQVRTELLSQETVRDAVVLPLGLRYFFVDAAKGFFLNGKYLDLHGVNRHQDRAGRGWVTGGKEEWEDFALIEEIGATMVRQSHYQQSQSWNDLGDRRGMVMWAELAYTNDTRDNREFFENAKEQLRELIRQNFHHPAIFFWSIGNETFVRDPKVMPADTNDRMLRELAAVVREEDPTRLSTYASNGNVAEPRAGAADVLGFNHYFGWYRGEAEEFAAWVDEQHALRPDLRIGMSEYGAGANIAHHEEPAHKPATTGQWHPEEWQAHYHEVYWQAMATRPWMWSKLVWCMFDFASDGRNEGGVPGINDKGLVTSDRKTRKDAFYFYQANWSAQPVLHIASRRFTLRTQPKAPVKVYSNAESVELLVNGAPQGHQKGTQGVFIWSEVILKPGENRIEVRATCDDRELKDECRWVYQAAFAPETPAK
jgi:beta-galactosidase